MAKGAPRSVRHNAAEKWSRAPWRSSSVGRMAMRPARRLGGGPMASGAVCGCHGRSGVSSGVNSTMAAAAGRLRASTPWGPRQDPAPWRTRDTAARIRAKVAMVSAVRVGKARMSVRGAGLQSCGRRPRRPICTRDGRPGGARMTTLELTISRFVEHKRAVGRKYESEEAELRLLVRFAEEHGASRLEELTPVLLDDFLGSRSRPRPRGFNHLLGVVRRLLNWAVAHELLEASPLQTRPRRETATRIPFLFDVTQARRLLDAAAALPDYTQAPQRGATYRTI